MFSWATATVATGDLEREIHTITVQVFMLLGDAEYRACVGSPLRNFDGCPLRTCCSALLQRSYVCAHSVVFPCEGAIMLRLPMGNNEKTVLLQLSLVSWLFSILRVPVEGPVHTFCGRGDTGASFAYMGPCRRSSGATIKL